MSHKENIMHQNRIVIDLDDTISMTITRDWENAEPIWDVINRVNYLYDMGWEVVILTARGQLSCKGDYKAADKKYRSMIELWLNKHGVKYHTLSFEKPLATYYIDDKAMRPDEFVDLEIRNIKSGWSGAEIQKRGDRIYKTHNAAPDAAKWYLKAGSLVNVPKIHSLIGTTLCMEYLKDNDTPFKLDEVIAVINTFALASGCGSDFSDYIQRVKSHCDLHNNYHYVIDKLEERAEYYNTKRSFCHGDLSIENIIMTGNGMYLIDPLYFENGYSSFLLDVSKMLCSFRLHNRMFEYEIFLRKWIKNTSYQYELKLLELTHFIRILKYAPDSYKDKIKKIIECFKL